MSDLEIKVIPDADPEAEEDHDVKDVVTTHMTAKETTDVVEEAWNEITRSEQAALKEKIVTRRDQPVAMQEFLQVVAKHVRSL
jgi:phosphoribosylformylglycinamidine (FGAM) synthase-like enzyme